ncbi:MAG TPA: hypothetical protein VIR29_04975 [Anseongella sp.]
MKISEKGDGLISERFERGIRDFMEYYSPAFLSRNLRRMAFLYMRQSLKEGIHDEMSDFLDQLDALLDFLDLADEETRNWRTGT